MSEAQRTLAGRVKYPRPCRLCWVWKNGDPPPYLMYVRDEYSGVWVKRCIACTERAESFAWIAQIHPALFDAFVNAHMGGFTLESLMECL